MRHGFTLIETLIVISLSALIASVSITDGVHVYTNAYARTSGDLLVGALREARAESMNAVCESTCSAVPSHGVLVSPSQFTIFEGSTYANRIVNRDETFPISTTILHFAQSTSSSPESIIFAPETGDVASTTIISLLGNNDAVETITINTQGEISPVTQS